MKRTKIVLISVGLLAVALIAFAQQPGNSWTLPGGTKWINCPLGTCNVSGQAINLTGLSQTVQLIADTAGSATNTLVTTGITFPIAANQTGKMACTIYYTSGTSGGGLTLAVTGPGSPTELTQASQINTWCGDCC